MRANRNIRLYPWFVASASLLFWFPVFFLYFSSKVSINQVLVLEAVYYACVVVMEVPSGYLSDRAGRRITLVISALCALTAYLLFSLANGFGLLVAAQCALAAHMAFKSGTDSSMLYESLAESGQAAQVGAHLARAQRFGLLAMAMAALIGGIAGGFNLVFPYVLAGTGALATLVLALGFHEPGGVHNRQAHSVARQLAVIGAQLRRPPLRWLFVFSVVIFVLVHVPYEFFQPYIRLLFPAGEGFDRSPLVGGILIAITMTLGSVASMFSMPLQQRFGAATALLFIMLLAGVIIGLMASVLHWLILLPIMLRSIPMALANPIVDSALHLSISDDIRASFLSTLSLLSRLAFSLTLFITALFIGTPDQLGYPQLRGILAAYLGLALLLIPFLLAGRRKIARVC